MPLPVGDIRQVSMGTEWLAEPQESGVYKRGSRGDDFNLLAHLTNLQLFYSTGTNLYFNLKRMCLIVIVHISDTHGQHWFSLSSEENYKRST